MFSFVLAITISLSVSTLCSIAEACLLSLSLSDIAQLSERSPFAGRVWKTFRENIHKPISVILITNTFAHTIGAAYSGSKFTELFDPKWIGLYSVVFSLVMIQWTEILPKTLAVRYNKRVARVSALPMLLMEKAFTPVLYVVELLNRPFVGSREHQATADAVDEIASLTRFAAINKVISKEEERIVSHGINLSHTRVKEVMVGRDDIKFLSTGMDLTQALVASHVHHHTRYLLVREGNIDAVVGYVNFKDIVSALQMNPANPTLEGITRPVIPVDVLENLASVLRKMTGAHHHMAVVRDSRGATVGLITLEDIVESLIGHIQDEYDILPAHVNPVAEGRYFVGGGVSLHLLREKTGADLPDTPQTLDEWLRTEVLRRAPQAEEHIRAGGAEFTIKKMRRSKLFELTMAVAARVPAA